MKHLYANAYTHNMILTCLTVGPGGPASPGVPGFPALPINPCRPLNNKRHQRNCDHWMTENSASDFVYDGI